MIEKIMIASFSGLLCTLMTIILSILLSPKFLKEIIKDEIEKHKCDAYKERDDLIKNHEDNCQANQKFEEIKIAVFWLVEQSGGDPFKIISSNK